jgi:hypothetical protein
MWSVPCGWTAVLVIYAGSSLAIRFATVWWLEGRRNRPPIVRREETAMDRSAPNVMLVGDPKMARLPRSAGPQHL